jgi:hypothetical protein
MSANVEAMVREGINAYKAGRKEEARALLLKATELDQLNEQAWLWLSGLMDSVEDQRTCLENVLAINPNNERAKQGLSYLTGQSSASSAASYSGAPPAAPSPYAPTSVEWGAPPEEPPARSAPAVREPSSEALDDWVTNLNLPVNEAKPDTGASPFSGMLSGGSSSPFGDFDVDDDSFGDGPFSSSPLDLDDETAASPSRRSTPPAERTRRSSAPPERRQPSAERTRRAAAPRSTGSRLYDFEDEAVEDFDSGEGQFGYIPPEIVPTRLPGTRERAPILLRLGTVVLVLLNLGAAALVMMNLLS